MTVLTIAEHAKRIQPLVSPPRLPSPPDSLIGRQHDIQAIRELFAAVRLVTIAGPPGMGKTRLAIEIARQEYLADERGVWFCDLTRARSLQELCRDIGQMLGVPLNASPSESNVVSRLGHALAARGPALVVVDNFEQLVAFGPATIAKWLECAPDAAFLLTSREILRLTGEHVYPLGPLGLPEPRDDPDSVWEAESAALFAVRAQASGFGPLSGPDDAALVSEIVRKLEGIPLAIELAAARAGLAGSAALLEHLPGGLDELSSRHRDVLPRHATLRAAIDWSWASLSPAEQAALAQSSVFAGGFDLAAATQIWHLAELTGSPLAEDVLARLRDKSLIRSYRPDECPETMRFSLFESIREYAAEKLAELNGSESAQSRHAAYYLGLAEDLAATAEGASELAASKRVVLELDNLIAAYERATRSASSDACAAAHDALRAVAVLDSVLALRGTLGPHLARLTTAIDLAARAGYDAIPVARTLLSRARLHLSLGAAAQAEPDALRAQNLAEARGDEQLVGRALLARAEVAFQAERFTEARELLDGALQLCRRIGDDLGVGMGLTTLGHVALAEGRLRDTEAHYYDAIDLFRSAGHRRRAGHVLANLAGFHLGVNRGDAIAELADARTIAEDFGDRVTRVHVEAELAFAFQDGGDLASAQAHYRAACALARMLGDQRLEAVVLSRLGTTYHEAKEPQQARRVYEKALAIFGALGADRPYGLVLSLIAGVEAACDLPDRASDLMAQCHAKLGQSRRAAHDSAVSLMEGLVELALARRARRQGELAGARRYRAAAAERARAASESAAHSSSRKFAGARFALRLLEAALAADPAPLGRRVITLDGHKHEIRSDGESVSLRRCHAIRKLLYALATVPNETVDVEVLASRLYDSEYDPLRHSGSLRVTAARLRALVRPFGFAVEGENGGYRLVVPKEVVLSTNDL